MMLLQILWFVIWGILWVIYFVLDGFDLGVGLLHSFVGKNEGEKRMVLKTIEPLWDGNEVWLITAGAATFAAFPTTYALMFSYLYSPLLIILFALIFRGVAIVFRSKGESEHWKRGWDLAIFFGSFIPSLLFGVAFGNIFRGLPMDAEGYHGSLFTLLNPYGLITGALFVMLILVHGALWLAMKTEGDITARAMRLAGKAWFILALVVGLFLIFTAFATRLYDNYLAMPVWFIIPALVIAFIVGLRIFAFKKQFLNAFYSSCLLIVTVMFTGFIGLYPNLIPSNIDLRYSLTIFNSSSSAYTLKIMTIVVLLFVPVVIAYQVWMHIIFRHRVSASEILQDEEGY
jgi:cytochrome d ubiquinol oxidase subunit II